MTPEQPKDLIARLDEAAPLSWWGDLLRDARSTIAALQEQVERLTETVVCEENGVPAVNGVCLTHKGDGCLVVRGRLIDRLRAAEDAMEQANTLAGNEAVRAETAERALAEAQRERDSYRDALTEIAASDAAQYNMKVAERSLTVGAFIEAALREGDKP